MEEASDHFPRVHPHLDDLRRDPAADRFLLLRAPDRAEAAFPEQFQQLVGTDCVTGLLVARRPGRESDGTVPDPVWCEKSAGRSCCLAVVADRFFVLPVDPPGSGQNEEL